MYRYGISLFQKWRTPNSRTDVSRKTFRNWRFKMTKWWVELGDLYVSSELIERILKEHEEAEDEGI